MRGPDSRVTLRRQTVRRPRGIRRFRRTMSLVLIACVVAMLGVLPACSMAAPSLAAPSSGTFTALSPADDTGLEAAGLGASTNASQASPDPSLVGAWTVSSKCSGSPCGDTLNISIGGQTQDPACSAGEYCITDPSGFYAENVSLAPNGGGSWTWTCTGCLAGYYSTMTVQFDGNSFTGTTTSYADGAATGTVFYDGTCGNCANASYKVSGNVYASTNVDGSACSPPACPGVGGVNLLVTGTNDDGSAVSATAVSAPTTGAWSVTVPAGSYTAGPSQDGSTFGPPGAFKPASQPVAVNTSDVPGINFTQVVCHANTSTSDSARAITTDARPQLAAASCGTISLSPATNVQLGDQVTITGAGWNPKNGDVLLYYLDPATNQNSLIGTVTPDTFGAFTQRFTLKTFDMRGKYPDLAAGCGLVVQAKQQAYTTQGTTTSPGIGHVAYARYADGTAPFATGDVYCRGENPVAIAGDQDIVVTIPSDITPPVPGLTGYQIAATPLNINLRGSTSSNGPSRQLEKASLYAGGVLCLSPGSQSRSIVVDFTQIGYAGTCPNTFPAQIDNPGVRSFGVATAASHMTEAVNTCLGLANAFPDSGVPATLGYDFDCKLALWVGAQLTLSNPSLVVDGSLRVVNPYVNIQAGTLIVAGAFDASAGISDMASYPASPQVIVGQGATFGIGPPYRGFSPQQKTELQALLNANSSTSTIATDLGNVDGGVGVPVAVINPEVGLAARAIAVVAPLTLGMISSWGAHQGALKALIADPPDPHYRAIARPAAASLPASIQAGRYLTAADARIVNALLTSLWREIQVGQALASSVDRAGGAAQAGNTSDERKQIAAAVRYAVSDADLLDARPRLLAAAARVLRSLPAGRFRPTAKEIAAARSTLRVRGFSAKYVALERRLGVTTQQLDLYRLNSSLTQLRRGSRSPQLSAPELSLARLGKRPRSSECSLKRRRRPWASASRCSTISEREPKVNPTPTRQNRSVPHHTADIPEQIASLRAFASEIPNDGGSRRLAEQTLS